jgi:hypothetical protein
MDSLNDSSNPIIGGLLSFIKCPKRNIWNNLGGKESVL